MTVTRRQLLGAAGAAGAAWLAGGTGRIRPFLARAVAARDAEAATCLLTPPAIEGPFFVDEHLVRSDITGDPSDGSVQAGVPLRLGITVLSADAACAPVAGAVVDVWHANAAGLYSDESSNGTAGRKFLRGSQRTDATGRVEFTSIYPGWYPGRTIHVHVKVRVIDGSSATYDFTSQLYFDDATSNAVLALAPYAARGPRDTTNATDGIYDPSTLLALDSDGGGWIGTIVLGLTGLPACSDPVTCLTALAAALPATGAAADRRRRRVARRLALRLARASAAISRADASAGARRARQYRRARAALAQLLAGARAADAAGTLGVPLLAIEEGTAAVLAGLPTA